MGKFKKSRERLVEQDAKDSSVLFHRHLAGYMFALDYVKDKTFLDLGCSDGYGTFLLAKEARNAFALDIDKKTIHFAKQKYQLKNLSFKAGDALEIRWRNKFEAVVSFQVIEHINEIDIYLSIIKKTLKKNGVVIFSTPNRKLRLRDGEKPWNPYHVHEYEAQELHNILKKHFNEVSVLGLYASPDIYKFEKRRLKMRRIIARIDIFNMYERFPREYTDWFVMQIKRYTSSKKKRIAKITSKDFWVTNKKVSESLDLIAVCRK